MRAVLQGVSGSGKTSKLLQLALCSARQGRRVLIVGISCRLRSVPLQGLISTDTDEILNRIQFRYVESIEDVMSVFIRLHLTNKAPHVVLVDDISTMQCRDKIAAATVAILCNALEWIEKVNRCRPMAIICDTTDAQGSSSMGYITGRWAFQTHAVSEFDQDAIIQKYLQSVPESDAADDATLFGDE